MNRENWLYAKDSRPLFTPTIGWNGHYRIDGEAFVYRNKDSGHVSTIVGYSTQTNRQSNFKYVWLGLKPTVEIKEVKYEQR